MARAALSASPPHRWRAQPALRVFGTAGTDRGRQLAREQGAREVFDHTAQGYEKEILAKTGGRGVDLVIEMLANVNLVRDLELIAKRGQNRDRRKPWRARAESARDHGEGRDRGGLHELERDCRRELAMAHAAIVAGMERSGYRPQVGKEMPLVRRAARARRSAQAGRVRQNRLVI